MASFQCETCHGAGANHADTRRAAHGPVKNFGRNAETPADEQVATCISCHEYDISMAWQGSSHERNDTACTDCHLVHTAKDPVLLHATQNDSCFECHDRQRADVMKPSSHPLRADHPARVNAMVCTDCHNPHASTARALLTRDTTNELCFDCHAEFRGPVLFDHAPVSEDCSLCHQPHGSIHPALLVKRPPLLCQSCHSQSGHPSISYSDASLAGTNPSAMVLDRSCMNCHTQVHGSNHPSGYKLMR